MMQIETPPTPPVNMIERLLVTADGHMRVEEGAGLGALTVLNDPSQHAYTVTGWFLMPREMWVKGRDISRALGLMRKGKGAPIVSTFKWDMSFGVTWVFLTFGLDEESGKSFKPMGHRGAVRMAIAKGTVGAEPGKVPPVPTMGRRLRIISPLVGQLINRAVSEGENV
jgi:hypothetical protein